MNMEKLQAQVIPPARFRVKAGFVVFSPDSPRRNIIILDEGELVAVDKSNGFKKTIFTMTPGDLVGVAALLENEPFRYTIEAVRDSIITVVNEECMESELKTLPIWLLAVIKSLSAKTRRLKEAVHRTRCTNTLKSLAEFCSHQQARKFFDINDIVREFHWQTKIPENAILEDFKSLARRKLIEKKQEGDKTMVRILSPLLMQIFVDYQTSTERNVPWEPFQLSITLKRLLIKISSIDQSTKKDAPAWIAFFKEQKLSIAVSDWINANKIGWFSEEGNNLFSLNTDKIKYYLAALHYEQNIRGVL